MASAKKKLTPYKLPKMPKTKTLQSLTNYKKRVDAKIKHVDNINKPKIEHNKKIDAAMKQIETLRKTISKKKEDLALKRARQ